MCRKPRSMNRSARAGNAVASGVPGRGLSGGNLKNLVLYYHFYKPLCVNKLSSERLIPGLRECRLVHKATLLKSAKRVSAVMESPRGDKDRHVQQTGKTDAPARPAQRAWSPGAPPFVHALISHQTRPQTHFCGQILAIKK